MYATHSFFDEAQRYIPGGVNSPVRAFKGVGGTPLFFTRAEGPYLIDTQGNSFIDFVCSWGSIILGHNDFRVRRATQTALENGLSFGAPNPTEVEMAKTLSRIIPSLEKVRMVNSGTEATMSAIRLARGATGRDKILKFEGCYHGHADCLLVKAGSGGLTFGVPDSEGVPASFAEKTLTAPFNDIEATERLFQQAGNDIAAVIVEPIAANMNYVFPAPHFLARLRELCTQYGTLLIFDEVITGFRVALGGAQSLFNIQPDLTCLGKIIGGGLPVGAFGGRADVMDKLAPLGPVYQAGTLSGNPVTLAAGLANIKALQEPRVFERLHALSGYFANGLKTIANRYSIPFQIQYQGGLFGFVFHETLPASLKDVAAANITLFKKIFHELLELGVYLAPSAFEAGFLTLTHEEAILDDALNKMESVFKKHS